MKKLNKTIIIGIGNSGREDDGLGWAFVDEVQMSGQISHYDFEYRYQLQIEDAELISQYDFVVFVDAHVDSFKRGFLWEKCHAIETTNFSSHELSPETILFLSGELYKKYPETYFLGISGEKFALKIGMSSVAQKNLSKALSFFKTNPGLGGRGGQF